MSCLLISLTLTSTWPHLRCDVGLEEGVYRENCVRLAVLCTIIMVHKDTSSSYRSVICIGLWSCLFSSLPSTSSWCYIYVLKFFCLHPSLYLLVSWAWWDWPLTSLTNHHSSVLWRCWLGHLTRKIVSEMTYNVASGTLNTTIPYYYTIPHIFEVRCWVFVQR